MRLKRLLFVALLVGLALGPVTAMAQTRGIANQVPVLYISDAMDAADALMDDNAATAWYGTADRAQWTVLTSSATVKEIWVRTGMRVSPQTYLSTGRPTLMEVTIYDGAQQVSTYRYRLLDVYAAENSRDWVDGYQRLLLPQTMYGVFCIELRALDSARGQAVNEIALSDILLSSGQPSPYRYFEMRAPAPTIRPANPTLPPSIGDGGASSPTMPPLPQNPGANSPTMPPLSGDAVGISAKILKGIGVRTGPGTGYDYVGSYFQGGETLQVVSKVWDPVNELYWLQVDFVAPDGKNRYRGYCVRELRVDIDPAIVPDDPEGTPASVVVSTGMYYGPGDGYRAHRDTLSAGTKGSIFAWENGCVLFEWNDRNQDVRRRAWIPESAVSW